MQGTAGRFSNSNILDDACGLRGRRNPANLSQGRHAPQALCLRVEEKITARSTWKFSVISAFEICREPTVTDLGSPRSRRIASENAETSPSPPGGFLNC